MKPLQFGKNISSQNLCAKSNQIQDVAIVGIHGVFPGARNKDDFWKELYNKTDLIKEIPTDHFDYKTWFDPRQGIEDKMYSKWGSFIDDIDKFDADFFNITPIEAEVMDPQLRYLLQVLYGTIEDAGAINDIKGSNTGLYVGVCFHDYAQEMSRLKTTVNPHDGTGNAATMLANRPSFYFDLKGPSMVIDTACSSSLIALHTAFKAIQQGECEQALVAGANLLLTSLHYRYFCSIGALSPTGRCHTFDSQADGYVPGESVAAVMMKPLEKAIADNDNIYAVIKGSATTHGGYTPSITAPSVDGEVNVLLKAWEDAEINPNTIGYIEAHGTGTKLGDPVEINALKKAFKKHTENTDFCAIGSAKAHVGHTEGAAGIVGVIKAILSIKNREIPAMPKFESLNPYINLNDSPFYINQEPIDWITNDQHPLRAGISSFGFGGAYAHMVIEEYLPKQNHSYRSEEPAVIILSAKNKDQLSANVRNLKLFLESNKDLNIHDIAYTLQIGREPMEERFGVVVSNTNELIQKLETYSEGIQNNAPKSNNISENESAHKKHGELLDSWSKRVSIDWSSLYPEETPSKISLPTYTFAKNRYWFSNSNIVESEDNQKIHPLLHIGKENTENLIFESTFNGNESVFNDHQVSGDKVLPGVAFIELIRATGEEVSKNEVFQIKDLTWTTPIVVEDDFKQIQIRNTTGRKNINCEITSIADHKEILHCSSKIVLGNIDRNPKRIDVKTIISESLNEISGKEVYQNFYEEGLHLGETFQGVERIYVGDSYAFSKINLPLIDGYKYTPGILDSALHTIYGLATSHGASYSLSFPYHVNEINFYKSFEDVSQFWGLVRKSNGVTSDENITSYDIDLMDQDGQVLLSFKNFVALPVDAAIQNSEDSGQFSKTNKESICYIPIWDEIRQRNKSVEDKNEKIVLLGHNNIDDEFVQSMKKSLNDLESEIVFQEKLNHIPDRISNIYFLHGISEYKHKRDFSYVEKSLFQTIKYLISNHSQDRLKLTFFTCNTQKVSVEDKSSVFGAGIPGLVGSLAKEQTNWKIRMIDFQGVHQDFNDIKKSLELPYDRSGELICYKRGSFLERKLYPMDLQDHYPSRFRKDGVYVILGGSGGIGQETTKYLVKKYNAQIIWLGRSPLNKTIETNQNKIELHGKRPQYIQCDALERLDVFKAYDKIKANFPTIHGLFHSALVLNDMRLENMDESNFAKSFLPKSLGSHNFIEPFLNEPLDFICFYSSVQSQWNAMGQSNYSAGCTYKDTYARHIEEHYGIPAYVINWGYWGEVGVVSSKDYESRFSQSGIGSISANEGMEVLELVLSNKKRQIVSIKLSEKAKSLVDNISRDKKFKELSGLSSLSLEKMDIPYYSFDKNIQDQFQKYCSNACFQVLIDMGLKDAFETRNSLSQYLEFLGIAHKYERLFKELIRNFLEIGYVVEEKNIIKIDPIAFKELKKFETENDTFLPGYKPHKRLVDQCITYFDKVLRGEIAATDIVFPNGSSEYVSEVYKDNNQADYFNNLIADSIVKTVSERIKKIKKGEKINILEVGAGTGGTSQVVFDRLQPYAQFLNYVYTDISKSFLLQAESNFQHKAPYMSTAIFDIEKPASSQNIPLGSFDIVIAANVVHATKNIKNTLHNIKAVLKKHGLLFLNELKGNELFTTLTFGLLDGWWLFEDEEIREKGSPGLSPDNWLFVLESIGFMDTSIYPENNNLSQQMIITKSDGYIRTINDTINDQKIAEEKVNKPRKHANDVDQTLQDRLKNIAAETIKYDKDNFDISKQFMDYGFDSILGASLIKNINEQLKIELSPVDIFNYPNIQTLSEYIGQTYSDAILFNDDAVPNVEVTNQQSIEDLNTMVPPETSTSSFSNNGSKTKNNSDIAIIGMSGQYGRARDLEEFWTFLKEGESLVEEVPSSRWDFNQHYSPDKEDKDKTYSKWGSFLRDIDKFDPLFFGISGAEAEMMDPQQRLFLEHCWKAIEDAGIDPKTLSGTKSGVYVGASTGDYLSSVEDIPASAFWGNSSSILASRISYFLNLKGPAVPIDTACSSSLVALDMGCKSLINMESDLIITGGVNVMTTPNFYKLSSRAGMLSPDGKCYSFDSRANGFVPGEGVGVIVMKRLSDAERDGDRIYGVIKGSVTNQDGTSNGILAPSVLSQTSLEKEAYEKFAINPESVTYVEAHGTGTELGDPIEFEALKNTFESYTSNKQFCSIGSVKTNIGHTLMAAGIAGVIKVLLSMKYQKIPPSLNFSQPNPLIDFENSPFKIQDKLTFWEPAGANARRASVSSFGFSGTNAYVLLEEYLPKSSYKYASSEQGIFILSAKNKTGLKKQGSNLLNFLNDNPNTSFFDIAYTLQSGRESMDERLAIIANSIEHLKNQLKKYVSDTSGTLIFTGNVKKSIPGFQPEKKDLEKYIENRELSALAEFWINGINVEWEKLYNNPRPNKISLPTYPFSRGRFWKHSSLELDQLKNENVSNEDHTVKKLQLFQKEWVPFTLEHTKNLPGLTLVVSDGSSTSLIKELERSIERILVVSSIEEVLEIENVVGLIDITPLEDQKKNNYRSVELLQNIINQTKYDKLKLLIVSSLEGRLTGAVYFGVYHMLQAEYSKVCSTHIEIEENSPLNQSQRIVEAYQSNSEYTQLRFRNGNWLHPILETVHTEKKKRVEITGTVLITGGTRGLGMACAKHLVEQYNIKKLVLMGKERLPDRDQWKDYMNTNSRISSKIKDIVYLESKGARVRVLYDSLSDKVQLSDSLRSIKSDWGNIELLLHAAGSVDTDTPGFLNKSIENIEKILQPKVSGLNNLHEVLKDHDLKYGILFSSISALIPRLGTGQSDYVMANSYMDYFANYQQMNGHNYMSIQWPSWKEGSMQEIKGSIYERLGFLSISKDAGLAVLDNLLSENLPYPVVFPAVYNTSIFNKENILKIPERKKIRNIQVRKKSEFKAAEWLQNLISEVLKLPVEDLGLNVPFQEFGVDSILLVQLIKSIESKMGNISISPTVVLENPTISELSDYLLKEYPNFSGNDDQINISEIPKNSISHDKTREEEQLAKSPETTPSNESIAVVGMACHFPDARNINEYWNNLKKGRDSIKLVPKERWDTNEHYDSQPNTEGKSISKWGGFLDNIEDFDPAYFGIDETLASQIDPLQRQWLEVSIEAIQDSGHSLKQLSGKKIGVYAGSRVSTFKDKITDPCKDFIVGTGQNFIAAHLAHIYNFKGPNMVVDTACSSSITAIDLAVKGLLNGETEIALAGGVDIILDEKIFISLTKSGVLSPDGISKTFDESADGTGLGEGCGVLVLKKMSDAINSGDKIYGVIDSTSLNNDGRTMGITTPNPKAQESLLEDAITKRSIDPTSISYIETHGTGTLIGDPIELKGITRVLEKYTDQKQICGVGSVKSNFGHLLSAAGVAGVIKTLLSISAGQIPPTLHCTRPNRRFEFKNSPVYPVRELQDWTGVNNIRRAGVSAFGLGGNNAFILLSNEGIPENNKIKPPFQVPDINYNRKRYWPEEKTSAEIDTNMDAEAIIKEEEAFNKYLNFETN
ncbi:SDR family NAD(P)-dependent oxidoreductase [uncultured Aquimarina sp.]|uniref:SDR family NAD(P)-dependent oxidoreductase n=1 Tax=uncultured Aquimarina sp. TaxID=575652 RepID=UPI00260BDA6C|nr:SDR family NAD(P)-dependent oxidoreductase [uncultured Aquimarina sp.]